MAPASQTNTMYMAVTQISWKGSYSHFNIYFIPFLWTFFAITWHVILGCVFPGFAFVLAEMMTVSWNISVCGHFLIYIFYF